MRMTQKQNILTKTGIVALLACVCCILWGSAIPVIKTGYRFLHVDSSDIASQIVFAGVRFTLAGILVLIFASIREKKVMIPDKEILKYAVPVCLAQTVGQYFFFYIGVANTSGVKGGIITGLGNFIAILLSCLVFRNERMTRRKIAGCVLGFAGVVVINLLGNSLDMGFKLIGEGGCSDCAAILWNFYSVDQPFFQKSISGCIERNAVYDGWNRSDADWSRNGWTSGKCYYRGCGNYILSGNGFGSGIYALVRTACLERCFQSCYLWICEPALWRDFISTDTWRGETGI